MQDFVNTTDIIPAIKTDHAATELNLTGSNQNAKGLGFWKMNVLLLEYPNYLEELKQNIPLWKTTESDNLSDKRCIWDWLKYNILLLFCSRKRKPKNDLLWKKSCNKYKRKQLKNSNRTLPFPFPTPGCTLLSNIPRQNPRKAHAMKISPNKTLQSLFINAAASPKIHVPVTAAIIRFNHNPCYTA